MSIVSAPDEKNVENCCPRGARIYLWPIHAAVQQKQAQFCKAISLQLKNKLKKKKKKILFLGKRERKMDLSRDGQSRPTQKGTSGALGACVFAGAAPAPVLAWAVPKGHFAAQPLGD